MIDIEEVLVIHEILIEEFGGIKGVRDRNLLESSIHRPFSTFDGQDLYKTPVD
jgi:death-on-curing protein